MIARLLVGPIVLLLCLSSVNPSHADPTPKEILTRADEARGNLQGVKWRVQIDSLESERRQQRKLTVNARGYDFLSILTSPPKVKGQKLLMIDHNMWFAKPGLRKSVPVSPRQKLLGGASYGDIAATNYANDYEATPLDDEVINGELCYRFDLKAAEKKATYDRIKYWVSKERLVGVKAEFFSVSGKIFKTAIFKYENKVRMGDVERPFISEMFITDAIIKDNVTTMHFKDPLLRCLPDSTFDLNLLMTR